MFTAVMNNHDIIMYLLRVVVGVIFIWHGWPKFKQPEAMAGGMGWPRSAVMILGALEILAGLGVIFGVFLQWAALIMAVIMLGAIYHKIFKWKTPFWTTTATGWELDLLLLASALLILASGPESFSLTHF